MKTKIKKVFSICLSIVILSSFCISNCFAMRPNRLGQSGGQRQCSTQRRAFIGPPPPLPKEHIKYEPGNIYTWEHMYSWLDLGIGAAELIAGCAGAGAVAAAAKTKTCGAIIGKATPILKAKAAQAVNNWVLVRNICAKTAIGSGITAGMLNGISHFTNDLSKTHGVKIVVSIRVRKKTECRCKIGENHGNVPLIEVIASSCQVV